MKGENASKVVQAGAIALVAGSAVNAADHARSLQAIKAARTPASVHRWGVSGAGGWVLLFALVFLCADAHLRARARVPHATS